MFCVHTTRGEHFRLVDSVPALEYACACYPPAPTSLAPHAAMTTPQSSDLVASANDLRLVEALRGGDEASFAALLDAYHTSMLRLAMIFVPDQAVAEEVVQEA